MTGYLYYKTSDYVLSAKKHNSSIGDGLFSIKDFCKGDIAAYFNGEFIKNTEANLRTANGRGGYMIYVKKNLVLDCYSMCANGLCLASKANSPRGVVHATKGTKGCPNSKLIVTYGPKYNKRKERIPIEKRVKVSLKITTFVPHNTEILYTYGTQYMLYK